jgi:hypothetical protein
MSSWYIISTRDNLRYIRLSARSRQLGSIAAPRIIVFDGLTSVSTSHRQDVGPKGKMSCKRTPINYSSIRYTLHSSTSRPFTTSPTTTPPPHELSEREGDDSDLEGVKSLSGSLVLELSIASQVESPFVPYRSIFDLPAIRKEYPSIYPP